MERELFDALKKLYDDYAENVKYEYSRDLEEYSEVAEEVKKIIDKYESRKLFYHKPCVCGNSNVVISNGSIVCTECHSILEVLKIGKPIFSGEDIDNFNNTEIIKRVGE